jgi:hypothetical protein
MRKKPRKQLTPDGKEYKTIRLPNGAIVNVILDSITEEMVKDDDGTVSMAISFNAYVPRPRSFIVFSNYS